MRSNPYLKVAARSKSRYLIDDFTRGLTTLYDESALGYKAASKYCNFAISGGVLTDGWGIEEYPRFGGAHNITAAWEYVKNSENGETRTLMYCDKEGFIHEIKEGADTVLSGVKFSSPPLAVGYRLYGEDVVLMCSESDGMAVYDGHAAYKVDSSPSVTSMALHYERLFVTTAGERNTVRFSDDLDPTNWAEDLSSGGFIQLADDYGKSNKVVSFLNYLYIFRDFGISRMVAYAEQTQFSVSNLYVSAGRIFPDSVTVCGDRVIFLASDGLYVFDGLSTSRLLKQLKDITPYKESAKGKYHNGKYYLAYSAGGGENDSLLVYDLADKTVELSKGFTIDAFVQGNAFGAISQGRAVKLTTCGAVLGAPTAKVWRVPFNSFSRPDKVKRLKEIYIETASNITLKVLYDDKVKVISVKGGGGVQRINAGVSGRKIGLEIRCENCGARIAEAALVIGS